MLSKTYQKSGMTLLEVSIVLLILSFLGTSFIASSQVIDRIKLKYKAQEIVSAVEYAKQASLITGLNHNVQIKNNTFRVYQMGESKTLIYTIYLEPNQVLTNESNTKTELTINRNGTIEQAITLSLRHKNDKWHIKITIGVATSKIRLY